MEIQIQIQEVTSEVRVITCYLRSVSSAPATVDTMRSDLTALSSRADMMDLRLRKAENIVASAQQLIYYQALIEKETIRMDISTRLRGVFEAQGGNVENLFDTVSRNGGVSVNRDDVQAYLSKPTVNLEVDKNNLTLVFGPPTTLEGMPAITNGEAKTVEAKADESKANESKADQSKAASEETKESSEEKKEAGATTGANGKEEKEEKNEEKVEKEEKPADATDAAPETEKKAAEVLANLPSVHCFTREEFNRTIRMYYKVVKEIVLSDNLLIEQSAQIRRMSVGEVIEVSSGPATDSSIGVYRIHGRALRDGIVGWATIAGNQGITFLTPGGTIFKVTAATALTEDLKDLSGTTGVRMLVEGEILEVVDWARTSRSALGVTRVRAKACRDGAEGWATICDNDGGVFLAVA